MPELPDFSDPLLVRKTEPIESAHLFYLFKELAFNFIDLYIIFFVSISFISALIFMISLLLLT